MAADSSLWSAEWSNAVFSLSERDRRWANVRTLMVDEKIDLLVCLPCTAGHDRGQADARYLTQLGENSDETIVAFPISGEVTAWHSRGGVWPSSNWISDIRAAGRGTGGETLVSWIRERPQFRKATIGIAGLTSSHFAHVRAAEGEANWQSVEILKQAFPEARFVSATNVLGRARWRKTAEEIEFLRKGTTVAEATLDALYASARPGVSERHVFAHMMFANADAGGSFPPMVGWVSGSLYQRWHRLEQPTFRTLQTGDVIQVEIEGRWGGYVAQIDQTVALGITEPILQDAMRFACDSFDRIMGVLKPGVTVAELVAAGSLDGLGGRIRTSIGGHGRGTGDDGPLLTARNLQSAGIGDIVIEEGCSFALKPAAALDGKADFARWGDTVVVTKTGAERLGTRPQQLRNLS